MLKQKESNKKFKMSGVREINICVGDCACGRSFEGDPSKVKALMRMHHKLCKIGREADTLGKGEVQQPKVSRNSDLYKTTKEAMNNWEKNLALIR
jgi:hypothetical protein